MIKVSDIVAGIVSRSFEATSMLEQGCLNLSAYAKKIQPEVERATKKPVQPGSIVIALSRLAKTLHAAPRLLPPPSALEVAARSGLMEIVYERTQNNIELFQVLQKSIHPSPAQFFMTTQGSAEITLIVSEDQYGHITSIFKDVRPKFTLRNLSALTVRTTEKDLFTPNVFFSTLYPFAMKRLNIVEIVSTYTEITMLFEDKDVQDGFEILKRFLK